MDHNLDLGPDAQINQTLSMLRGHTQAGDVVKDKIGVPGVYLSIDPAAKVSGPFDTAPGGILNARFDVETPGRWCAMHVEMGGVSLINRQILGFLCKTSSPKATNFRVCVRSGVEGGFVDCFLPKRVVSYAAPTVHVDLLKVGVSDPLPVTAPWRELVLFFDTQNCEISIHDMRVFLV